jgi:hypothetical protein
LKQLKRKVKAKRIQTEGKMYADDTKTKKWEYVGPDSTRERKRRASLALRVITAFASERVRVCQYLITRSCDEISVVALEPPEAYTSQRTDAAR